MKKIHAQTRVLTRCTESICLQAPIMSKKEEKMGLTYCRFWKYDKLLDVVVQIENVCVYNYLLRVDMDRVENC